MEGSPKVVRRRLVRPSSLLALPPRGREGGRRNRFCRVLRSSRLLKRGERHDSDASLGYESESHVARSPGAVDDACEMTSRRAVVHLLRITSHPPSDDHARPDGETKDGGLKISPLIEMPRSWNQPSQSSRQCGNAQSRGLFRRFLLSRHNTIVLSLDKNVRKQSRAVILQREAPRVNGSDVASCE